MELNIGTNIKRLRLAKGLTQEQLAELLIVSPAAVSKWEAKNTYPDITMLFPLAQIFGISIDELLGYDEAKAKDDVNKILKKYEQLCIEGHFSEGTSLIHSARKMYPHDYQIMVKYMWDTVNGRSGTDNALLIEHKDELIQICDCILEGCTEDKLRAEAINMKAKLLHVCGKTEDALALLSTLPSWHAPFVKEELFDKNSEEFRVWNKRNCYGIINVMAIKIARIIRFDPILTFDEKVNRIEALAEAFGEASKKNDLECFSIGEQAIYEMLASMLTTEKADVEDIIRMRTKQFASIEKVMHLARHDRIVKEQLEMTYKTDDMLEWQINRLLSSSNTQLAKLRENQKYVEMLKRYTK